VITKAQDESNLENLRPQQAEMEAILPFYSLKRPSSGLGSPLAVFKRLEGDAPSSP